MKRRPRKQTKLENDMLCLCVSLILNAPRVTLRQVRLAGRIIKRLKAKR